MAQLKNKYFGELKGRLGDIVFRQRGETNYISQQPRSYKMPQNPEHLKRLNIFGISTKLASVVNSVNELKFFWSKKKSNNILVFNYLVSALYSMLKFPESASLVKITPEHSFGLRVKSVNITETNFDINIEPLGNNSGINTSEETKVRLVSIMWLFEPTLPHISVNEFNKFVTDFIDLNINENITFSTIFNSDINELLKLYSKVRIYCTLITYSNEFVLYNYSNTYFVELPLR